MILPAHRQPARSKIGRRIFPRRRSSSGVRFVLRTDLSFWTSIVCVCLLMANVLSLPQNARAQTPLPPPMVRVIMNSMTPEERVGQLFLVAFQGTDSGPSSQIAALITRYHVGGVILRADNDNFTAPNTLSELQALLKRLQELEWEDSTRFITDPASGERVKPVYIPLFLGIAQEGNSYPTDQILSGLTPLPSEMAIGATWNPALAQQVGEIRGRELAALGFNLLLGPSLDVLETPSMLGGDLGARVFGGDPFWVSEMGRAYVAGLHRGSERRLFVAAKHFPGIGAADRLPEEEVSTVRKSLEQLKQIELAPFMAVTGNALSPDSAVNGLVVSHIRYQGFQGNIRATTRPVSFDPQALGQIIALPQFSEWHANGGLLISDNLGANSVREFYAAGGGQFFARVAARDAFLAGNDMMYLGNIKSNDAPDVHTTVVRVMDFFAQKYREDSAFAQRVDASVARIIEAKLGLYGGSFDPQRTIPPDDGLESVGAGSEVTFAVARNSATLISPDRQDMNALLPLPPQSNEWMVFLTDTLSARQCSACPAQSIFPVNALENAVLQLYGPQSGSQVEDFRLTSHSFQGLQTLLDNPAENEFLRGDLERAHWIVISMTGVSQGQPALISRFLRERSDLIRDSRVIVFAFDAPYYFDTTTLSKFTAYYALYSKQPQFVDVAARLLFQEVAPLGASPVSIPAVGYDLISALSPDPRQIISLTLDLPPAPVTPGPSGTPEPTPIPLFRIGDTIAIRTGVIRDHNGHTVPDGTVVQFSMQLTGEGGGILQQVESVTSQGVARASFGLDKPGLLEIRASSEPAVISEALQLDVSQSGAVAVTVVAPVLTPSIETTPEAAPQEGADGFVSEAGFLRFSVWLVCMTMLFVGSAGAYLFALRLANSRAGLRWALGIWIGGLLAYNLFGAGLFGALAIAVRGSLGEALAFVAAGGFLGLLGGAVWSRGLR